MESVITSNTSHLVISLFLFFSFFMSHFSLSCLGAIQRLTFTQTLDHFGTSGGNSNTSTFQQRFMVEDAVWAGAQKRGPIFVYLGAEADIDFYIDHVGVMVETAARLKALVVYIEHRFYGPSIPFGSVDNALANVEVRKCLTSEQALEDFASIIISLQKNLSANDSPVIVFGESYGGMLAAWFRLQYPHIATGALASSAPVLFFQQPPPELDFCSIVSRDFERINKRCSDVIHQSWAMIDEVASHADGLEVLAKTFRLCSALTSAHDLKVILVNMYSFVAQYNGRFNHWINVVCDAILETSNYNTLEGVAQAIYTVNNKSCVRLDFTGYPSPFGVIDMNSTKAWNWQLCNELLTVKGCNGPNSMLPQEVFSNKAQIIENCRRTYHVEPRLDWAETHFGEKVIQAGSNIIFSNGLVDPFSSYGIINDISDTIIAITTTEGSHCLDLNAPHPDDPKWLVKQRKKEIRIIEHWINGSSPIKSNRFSYILFAFLYLLVL